jgi:signal transduction histidine kinase
MNSEPQLRLLFVEDNASDAMLVRGLLERSAGEQLECQHVETLGLARRRVADTPFDAILLDLFLADSAGIETLSSMRLAAPRLPIVILTASDDEQTAMGALRAGARDYLVKGAFDGNLLWRIVRFAVEQNREEQARRELERQLVSAIGQEQQRIGQELHDGVGQALSGLNLMAQSLHRKLREKGIPEARTASQIADGIQSLLIEFRKIVHGLAPVQLHGKGLRTVIERLCEQIQEQSQILCRCVCEETATLQDGAAAHHLYRIAQEAVHNAMRHAHPALIQVRLTRENDCVTLSIADDGTGFDPSVSQLSKMGLRIMNYRAHLLGAEFSIRSAVGSGTTVVCSIREP